VVFAGKPLVSSGAALIACILRYLVAFASGHDFVRGPRKSSDHSWYVADLAIVPAPASTHWTTQCVRKTNGYFHPHPRNYLSVRSTNQHQPRTCGGFGGNAFVGQTYPDNLERSDVYPVALNFDQVGIFTLKRCADDSAFYFSLHAASSQGGLMADLPHSIGLTI
jgi:hypothetical protein